MSAGLEEGFRQTHRLPVTLYDKRHVGRAWTATPERTRAVRKGFRITASACLALVFVLALTIPSVGAPSAPQQGGQGLGLTLSKVDPSRQTDTHKYGIDSLPLAASKDLTGNAPPIGDQGSHSSCVGWAAGYYYKTWWEKVEHPAWDLSNKPYQFSPEFVWNGINGGVDGDTNIMDALQFMQNSGDTDMAEFPYDGDPTRQPDAVDLESAKQYRIPSDWGQFFGSADWPQPSGYQRGDVVTSLKQWLNAGQPFIMGVPIYEDFPGVFTNPSSSFYNHDGSTVFKGGHALFVAGYNDSVGGGQGGFLVLNSWGQSWNGNGRVYLSYDFVQHFVAEAWHMGDQDSSPTISSLMPANGAVDQLVTVKGGNFGARRRDARVGFAGGSQGSVVSWANDAIKVKVPSGARTGSMYAYGWDSERSNGKAFSVGPPSNAGADWLLAEGSTWPGFDEWVLLQNPNGSASSVRLTFLTSGGQVAGPAVGVPAKSRVSIHVNDYLPDADVSTAVKVVSGASICAERAMYFSTADKWGSHDSIAARSINDVWYLAEGATWPGYDEWILVMNPFNDPVSARITFQTPDAEVNGPVLDLAPNSRQSVHVNDYVPNADVSAKVQCMSSGYGVVAERSMYVTSADGKVDCHNSAAAPETASAWGLAEGATYPGYEEWVLIQNPTTTPALVDTWFLTPGKDPVAGPTEQVLPGRRVSIKVNDFADNDDVSTLVFTQSEDQQVVAERSMYVTSGDKRGSHNSMGSLYSSKDWLLPEGATWSGFDEWVLVMNPDPVVTAQVSLTFMTPGGEVPGPSATLGPASRVSFHVNRFVTTDVSTRVTSDQYVIAERAMYMNTSQGKQGATCSLGMPFGMLGQKASPGAGALESESLYGLKKLMPYAHR